MMRTGIKHIRILSLAVILLVCALGSCTQNNGYIGPIFGRWQLEEVESEGIGPFSYDHDVTWAFQSNIIQLMRSLPDHAVYMASGGFSLKDDVMRLSFPDSDNLPFLHLGMQREMTLDVLELKGNRMTLLYKPAEGQQIIYRFKRW